MRKIFLLFVLTFMPAFVFGQSECDAAQNFNLKPNLQNLTSYDESDAVVRSDISSLSLRKGPSKNYPVLMTIPPGVHVTVISRGADFPEQGYKDYDEKFVECVYRGVRGFVHSGYIKILGHIRSEA